MDKIIGMSEQCEMVSWFSRHDESVFPDGHRRDVTAIVQTGL